MADTKIPVPLIPVNQEKKEASLKTVSAEIAALNLKRQISMPELLLDQIHYISLEYWIIQSFFLIAAVVLFICFASQIKDSENILPPVCALSSGLGLAAVLELAKSRSCRMAELEQSCCFNLGQIWAVKLVFSAGINLCILTLLLFGTREQTEYSLFALCLYLLVPFIFSHVCYFFLLSTRKLSSQKMILSGTLFLVFLFSLFPAAFPKAYRSIYLPIWAMALAAGSVILAIELHRLFYSLTTGGKELCWN